VHRNRIAVRSRLAALAALVALTGCSRSQSATGPAAQPGRLDPADLPGVVDPWSWPRAAGASAHERAMEDIGPYEPADRNDPRAAVINTNAHYWTELVGVAWTRNVDIDFDDEPVDLNGDRIPDARLTRHVHALGGILANPALFGLTPTPDDPRGRVGRISVSTGFLGLREALRPDGTPSGQIGMTCWLCHGGANPTDGKVIPGLAGSAFDYGLLLATSRLLDEHDPAAVAYRRERGYPDGRTVRARLMMAGPGRQDLINEFGFDLTVPGFRSGFYAGILHARPRPWGAFNPLSVPPVIDTAGLRLQNWEGSEDSYAPALERLLVLGKAPEAEVLRAFGLGSRDRDANRRALLTDLRDVSTLSLQQDSYPGLMWSDAVYGRMDLAPAVLAEVPRLYAAEPVREELARQASALARPPRDPQRVARGRAIFAEAIVGEIENRQVLPELPAACASTAIRGPVLAPIDPSLPLDARLRVRCADCHNASPLERRLPFASNPPPLGRCSHCHHAHRPFSGDGALTSFSALAVPAPARAEVAYCQNCHDEHRDFGPVVYSSSMLFPFDADGDGVAQGDEIDDARAGGIGTEPLIQIEIPPTMRAKGIDIPVIQSTDACARGGVPEVLDVLHMGVMWVRAAPLTALFATAPYLHNGSVPTLRALLEPARSRPATFAIGAGSFVLDTRVPGNGNMGHEFGTRLSAAQKADLVAFLDSL
jgi:hypothetical protein